MIGVAIAAGVALGIVGSAIVLALWDGVRRALAAQVRQAELRVESQERRDVGALAADVARLASDLESLDRSLALGRRR